MATMHYPITFKNDIGERLVVYLDSKGMAHLTDASEQRRPLAEIASNAPVLRRELERGESEVQILKALHSYARGVYNPMLLDEYMDNL